jgi:putative CocE/NonD family hydrolase
MTDNPLPAPEQVAPGVVVHREVMIRTRDSMGLATDIYRPAQDGVPLDRPAPVIMERTPYGKAITTRREIEVGMTAPFTRAEVAAHFVRHGYVVIYQDCRGRHGSEGEFVKYLAEGADGFDAMSWIARQPWCDGRIGTMGLSYAAHTQLAAACLNPPGLATMILDCGGFANAYTCGIRQGGAFELKQATWAYNQAREAAIASGDDATARALSAENLREWFAHMPWSEGRSPLRWSPGYETYLLEQWRNEVFGDFWKQAGIYAAGFYDTIPDIPIVLMSGWYDAYVRSTLENFQGLGRSGKRPLQLIMGPFLHGERNATFAGDVEFGPRAPIGGNLAPSWLEFRRQWFDRWLKGVADEAVGEPAVRLFVMGGGSGRKTDAGRLDHGGEWISATGWPPPNSVERSFYLREAGKLSETPPAAATPPLTYDFDPSDPVPTVGGSLTSGEPVFAGGAFDQREGKRPVLPLSARRDVLSFETEPLQQDLAVVGPVEIRLFVSTDAPDTDFTAKLIDVHPPSDDYPAGFAMILTDGIFRCKFRHSFEAPEAVEAGRILAIRIEPFATANRFKAGHRLRLDISSSNFPKYDVNPNTGEPAGLGRTRRIARNTVYLDRDRPSRLVVRTLR